MSITKHELFIIGIIFVLGTKIFDFHNVFMIIGILLIFDAIFSVNNSGIEDSENSGDD